MKLHPQTSQNNHLFPRSVIQELRDPQKTRVSQFSWEHFFGTNWSQWNGLTVCQRSNTSSGATVDLLGFRQRSDVRRRRTSTELACRPVWPVTEGVVKVPSESRDPRRDVVSELKIKVCPGSVVFSLLWIMRRCHKKQPVLITVFIQFDVCYQ